MRGDLDAINGKIASETRSKRLDAARIVTAANVMDQAKKLPLNQRTHFLLAAIYAELKILNDEH